MNSFRVFIQENIEFPKFWLLAVLTSRDSPQTLLEKMAELIR